MMALFFTTLEEWLGLGIVLAVMAIIVVIAKRGPR